MKILLSLDQRQLFKKTQHYKQSTVCMTYINLIPSALATVHILRGFMNCYSQPNNCLLPQLFSLYSQLLTLADKLGHLGIQSTNKNYAMVHPMTSPQRTACLATPRLRPRENILRLCSHQSCCPGWMDSQVLHPSSEQLFHMVPASHPCPAPSTQALLRGLAPRASTQHNRTSCVRYNLEWFVLQLTL